ncbi:MAG: TVP38/TMEM64 family protein [Almyronema sp.]
MQSLIRHKRLWLLTGLGVVSLVCCRDVFHLLLHPDSLIEFLTCAGHWRSLAFMTAHVLATAIGVPGTLLVIVGGAVFGLFWGTVWSVVGATLGAIAAFGLARYLLHDWFKQRFGQWPLLIRLNQVVKQRAFHCVLAVRFAPISPFNVINFLFGLTVVPLKPYALGTFLGIIPGTLAYTWLGVTGRQALDQQNFLPLAIALSLLGLLSLLPALMRWKVS